MRIFVFEYITGGGMLNSALPKSLAEEGDMMLRALVSDLAEIDDVELLVTRDARLGAPRLPVECRLLADADEFPPVWQECLNQVDAVWPIAPESHRILEQISVLIEAAGKLLLNSPSGAVALAASKVATARRLQQLGVAVVPTFELDDVLPELDGQWVLKPNDGAGCLGSRICTDSEELYRQIDELPIHLPYIIQPFVSGMATSLCMLVRGGEVEILSVNLQRIAVMDNAFLLLGCEVNGVRGDAEPYRAIGQAIGAAATGLWGFVGVDLINTGSGLEVLEINPRLTTSYVGLKESIGVNPAALVMELTNSESLMPRLSNRGRLVDVNLECNGAA